VLLQRAAVRFGYWVMKILGLAALVMMLAACGTGWHADPGGETGFDVTVTEKDHSTTMTVGQRLEVVLHAPAGMKPWTHPVSSNAKVLQPAVDPAAISVRGVTLAAFEAVAPGEVQVTANAAPDCAENQPCAQLLAVYNLKVTVTPKAGPAY
jgi:hypothetical protein